MNLLLILFVLILPTNASPVIEASAVQQGSTLTPGEAAPDAVVKGFYRWYIDSLNRDKNPLTAEKLALKKYLMPEFFRKAPKLVEESGADVFICAQDWDKDWGKNVRVSRLSIQSAVATMTVMLSGTQMNHKLKVKMKRIGGAWKIDQIDPLDL